MKSQTTIGSKKTRLLLIILILNVKIYYLQNSPIKSTLKYSMIFQENLDPKF